MDGDFTLDVMETVRQSAMLADVTISTWSAEKSDRAIMEKVKHDNGAVGNVGRVIKNILAGADGKLKDTKGAFAAVRTIHYQMTLPWVADPHTLRQTGPRLLPTSLFHTYLDRVSKQKRKALSMLDEFIGEYPELVEKAKGNLGDLADAAYPSADEIRSSFRVGFDFTPIPAGTAFKGLSEDMLGKLSKGLVSKQQRMIEAAQKAAWAEVRDRVKHLGEKAADKDARFHNSTVENVKELLTLLPGWNLVGDVYMEEIANDIKGLVRDGALTGPALRDNYGIRGDTAAKAQSVINKLNQWGL